MLVMFDDELHTTTIMGTFEQQNYIKSNLPRYLYVLGDISKLWFIAFAVQLTCMYQLAVII